MDSGKFMTYSRDFINTTLFWPRLEKHDTPQREASILPLCHPVTE